MSDSLFIDLKSQELQAEKGSGQLQDFTMDQNFSNSSNSPMTHGSPAQGRTMKDYEEQLSSLRKENFNLKLNVYFLEERLYSSSHTPASQDNVLKKNIELKVNLEGVRRELSEKEELLCAAARALEMIEQSAARKEAELLSQISDMENQIHLLRESIADNYEDRHAGTDLNTASMMMGVDDSVALYAAAFNLKPLPSDVETAQKKNEQSCECHQLKALLTVERENVVSMRNIISTKDQLISEQRDQIEKLKNKEEIPTQNNLDSKEEETNHQLERLQQENLNACQMIQGCLVRIKQMDRENKKIKSVLQEKNDIISKLQMEESTDKAVDLQNFETILKAKENKINELENKLKTVCVLKENYSNISCQSDEKELNWVNSHLEQKINTLRESVYIKSIKDNGADDVNIKEDSIKIQHKNDLQQMLIKRLQEMAYFFDSLLSKRCIIGEDKRRKIENLLEQTIELPIGLKLNPDAMNILEETLMDSSFGIPSQVLKLENLTAVFGHHLSINDTTLPPTVEYKNLEDTASDNCEIYQVSENNRVSDSTIDAHSGDKKTLTHMKSSCCEHDKLVSRKNKHFKSNKVNVNTTWHGFDEFNADRSESECWSEPDRLVSLARMGGHLETSMKENISSEEEICHCCMRNENTNSKSYSKDIANSKHFENMERELKSLVIVKNNLETLLQEANTKISRLESNLENNEQKYACDMKVKQTEINELSEKLQNNNRELKEHLVIHEDTVNRLNHEINRLKEELKKSENKAFKLEKSLFDEQRKYDDVQQMHKKELKEINEASSLKLKEMQDKIETDWVSRVRYEALRKELDHGALQASQATLDKVAAIEQKNRSDAEAEHCRNMLGEAHMRINELEAINADLQNRLVHLENWQMNGERALSSGHLSNSSPGASSSDLGIEGDRLSLAELLDSSSSRENYGASLAAENVALREKLEQTQKAYQNVVFKLEQGRFPLNTERAMCQQVHKTISLLRQARHNLNHES